MAEETFERSTRQEINAASIQSLGDFVPWYAIGFVLIVFSSLVVARLASHHGMLAVGRWARDGSSPEWHWPYCAWVAVVFVPHTLREVYTSVLSTDKSWFAWSSFCVSSEAWVFMLISAFGLSMVIAYPAAILWQFGKSSNRPRDLDPTRNDGRWGVRSYLRFLHTWTILTLASTLVPNVVWLRALPEDLRLSPAYLIPSILVFLSALVVSSRFLANAVAIRWDYEAKLANLGVTWATIEARKPPPDPTIDFLGEHWWKLPAVILGILSGLWLMVQLFGVADILAHLIGR